MLLRKKGEHPETVLAFLFVGGRVAGKKRAGACREGLVKGTPEEGLLQQESPLRPSQCREYMRKVLAREFRGIVEGFVQEARSGSCQHVKLATELLNAPPVRRKKKSTLEQIWDKFERDHKMAEADPGGSAASGTR